MSEITRRDALIAACRANREDDLPRLVLADWLDETGSEADAARARLIRDCCHHRDSVFVGDGFWGAVCVFYDRGFITNVTATAEWWLAHGDDLVREHDVQRVQMTTWPEVDFVVRQRNWDTATVRFRAYRERERQIGVPLRWGGTGGEEDAARRLLEAHWPGVYFELPVPLILRSDVHATSTAAALYRDPIVAAGIELSRPRDGGADDTD